MSVWARFLVGGITLPIGVAILSASFGSKAQESLPAPMIATAFGAYLVFCSVICFIPTLTRFGGARIVAAGASALSLALAIFVVAKSWKEGSWHDLEVVYFCLVIGIGTGIYVFTGGLPRWLASALHTRVNFDEPRSEKD